MFFESPAAETIGQRGKEEVDLWGGFVTSSKTFRGPRPEARKIFETFYFIIIKIFFFVVFMLSALWLFRRFPRHSFLTQPLTHIISLPSIKLLVMQPRWPPGAALPPSDGPAQLSSLSEQFHFLIINLSARLCSASLFNQLGEDGGDARTHTHCTCPQLPLYCLITGAT